MTPVLAAVSIPLSLSQLKGVTASQRLRAKVDARWLYPERSRLQSLRGTPSRYVSAIFKLVPYLRELAFVPTQPTHEGLFVYLKLVGPVGPLARGFEELALIGGQIIGHLARRLLGYRCLAATITGFSANSGTLRRKKIPPPL